MMSARMVCDVRTRLASGGFSLVELMVSLLLGVFLTAGIVSVYLESKANYLVEEESARIQENGRFALDFIKRELTLAGFYAGKLTVGDMASISVTTDCVSSGNWAMDPNFPIEVVNDFDNTGTPTTNRTTVLGNCLTGPEIVDGSDLFSIKRSAGEATLKDGAYIDGTTAPDSDQWYLRVKNYGDIKEFKQGSDLENTDVGTDTQADWWEMYTKIFYLRTFSGATSSVDSIPTLCVEQLVGSAMTTDCLVEGVEDMQIEFGIDSDGDGVPNQYKSSVTATEVNTAVTARVYLLLRSINEVTGYLNEKTYKLGENDTATKFDDGYLRRIFTTTVLMRNATLPVGA